MKYDWLIVGSGLYGAVFAHEMQRRGKRLSMERDWHADVTPWRICRVAMAFNPMD